MMKGIKHTDWSVAWSRFKDGDMDCFQQIYNQFFDRLFQYGCKLTGNTELVEDSIQELFLTVYTNRNKLSDTDSVEFYLLKALKFTIYGKLRKEKRLVFDRGESGDFKLEFMLETEEPEDLEQEKIDLILKSLNDLSPASREIIYLKFYSNLNYQQIGEMLGIKPESAKKQVYRIVTSLRAVLKDSPLELLMICFRT
ncbi:RNA polymerase sigma factor [Gaoshiqia sp. Z1-71]|uniref:RNA polymerase sigma factor n=1 Tax=Gaoshiqia hydrogeniformans TaxID=3290090 RepID=UPI003BF7C0E0